MNVPPDLNDVVAVAAGARHSVALQRDGRVRWWNSFGGITATNAVAIAAGGDVSYALSRDGTVIGSVAVGLPAGLGDIVRIATSPTHTHSYALLADGTLVGWGLDPTGLLPLELAEEEFVSVASNGRDLLGAYTLALKPDGTVVGWGDNRDGQLDLSPGLKEVTALAAGPRGALALKADGTVASWGNQNYPLPAGLTGVVAIAAGEFHRLALKADGTLIQWPEPNSFVPSPPDDLAEVTAIACGSRHSLALTQGGTVIGWGQTIVPPGLNDVIAIAAAANNSLALKSDGTVTAWGPDPLLRQVPAGLDGVVAVAISGSHALALRSDGTIVRWGQDLSRGATSIPPFVADVVAIAAGPIESLAVRVPLRITKLELNGHPALSFHTFTERTYIVEASANVEGAFWAPLTAPVPGAGQVVTVLDETPATEAHRFYRLRLEP